MVERSDVRDDAVLRTPRPEWQAWLKGTIEELPDDALPPRRPFERPALANQTGTFAAYRPGGSLVGPGVRPAATGDYQAWTPE